MLRKTFLIGLLVTAFVFGFIGCDSAGTGTGPGTGPGGDEGGDFKVGDTGPGGGVIFYYSKTGFTLYESATDTMGTTCNYLEAAPADMLTPLAWGSSDLTVTGTSNGLGMGMKNTALILAEDPDAPAAKACNDYSSPTGASGWYLPSREELNILYQSGKGNFKRNKDDAAWTDCYWSSSQEFDIGAWYTRFSTGEVINEYQDKIYSVRAIRAFADAVPLDVIPEAIRDQFKKKMPIYDGYTPPNIAGQYLANGIILAGSSLSYDNVGSHYVNGSSGQYWGDYKIAFIKGANGKLSYRQEQAGSSSGSDDVLVQIVGSGNNFTAYFVQTGISDKGIKTKMSTVISGTLTTNGISNWHYAFVMLEKEPASDTSLVPVNTYRIFKDGDGTATKTHWYD